MKILIVSTLRRKIHADETASRSQIIFHLAEGLATLGHSVTLLGTGDSFIPGVTVLPVIPKGIVDMPPEENAVFYEIALLTQLVHSVRKIHENYDIIHNHSAPEFLLSLIENELKRPLVTTVHLQTTPYVQQTLAQFKKTHFVPISQNQRTLLNNSNITRTIYNGIDTGAFSYYEHKEDYLFWLGRLARAKNPDGSFMDPKGVRWAIQLARETNQRLLLAGAVEDRQFYDKDVKPYLSDTIRWIGPIQAKQGMERKEIVRLMQRAKAFLMTINWEEPFGLVMAEAMSCGTPVIGFRRGSVPELVVNGKTGFVVDPLDGIAGLIQAVSDIGSINPVDCRKHVEKYFSTSIMVNNYASLFKDLLRNE